MTLVYETSSFCSEPGRKVHTSVFIQYRWLLANHVDCFLVKLKLLHAHTHTHTGSAMSREFLYCKHNPHLPFIIIFKSPKRFVSFFDCLCSFIRSLDEFDISYFLKNIFILTFLSISTKKKKNLEQKIQKCEQ